MKRIFIITLALVALVFTSCKKDPIGGTAVQAASGQWDVSRYFVTTSGELVEPLWFPDEDGSIVSYPNKFMMLTYNNNKNEADKLYIDDLGYYKKWSDPDYGDIIALYMEFKAVLNLDANALTFSADEAENEYEPVPLLNVQGAIVKDAAKTAGGTSRDSIWVSFKIDDPDIAAIIKEALEVENFDHFLITGVRHTGFEKDN